MTAQTQSPEDVHGSFHDENLCAVRPHHRPQLDQLKVATKGVGFLTGTSTDAKNEFWGYQSNANSGEYKSTTFAYDGTAEPSAVLYRLKQSTI